MNITQILWKIKKIEFYLIMSIPVLFGMIKYKELKQCIKEVEQEVYFKRKR